MACPAEGCQLFAFCSYLFIYVDLPVYTTPVEYPLTDGGFSVPGGWGSGPGIGTHGLWDWCGQRGVSTDPMHFIDQLTKPKPFDRCLGRGAGSKE